MGRLILVSNRLPVTVRRRRTGGTEIVRSSGGLVAALGPIHENGDSLWIGNLGDRPLEEVRTALLQRRFIPVPISQAESRQYYLGYANSALWPLFHYMPERTSFESNQFEVYRKVNARFADYIAKHATESDTIWVHDYQLMLVPGMVRQRLPRARIGFFLHTPFPSSEMFRILPQAATVLRGIMGSDVIGLHTYEYARHLVSSLLRVLGVHTREGIAQIDGRQVRIATHPVGVDVQLLRESAESASVQHRVEEYRAHFEDRKIILGVERLDYTKGIPMKLAAFRRLLETAPAWRDRVVFVQIVVPSREDLQTYREQKRRVEQMVSEINGEFGNPGRVPIHYTHRSVAFPELCALYRVSDVGFVSPLRDGMNLVAKEYVACHGGESGVLVLSQFAGAAAELGEALRVNPWDIDGTAQALKRALEMGAQEQRKRMSAMFTRVEANNVHRWARRALRSIQQPIQPPAMTAERFDPEDLAAEIRPRFKSAARPILLLDYDGTLREFTMRPEDARPTSTILRILQRLVGYRAPRTSVVIISGRDPKTLSEWFAQLPVSLVAEHGAWTRLDPETPWRLAGSLAEADWKQNLLPILNEYVQRTPGSTVEEKTAALVWHYRGADQDLGRWQARELSSHLSEYLASQPVEVLEGNKIVEVRQQGVTKGTAFEYIADTMGPFDFELAMGDDTTDEDLFAALDDNAYTIHVGDTPSSAKMSLSSPASARSLLRALLED